MAETLGRINGARPADDSSILGGADELLAWRLWSGKLCKLALTLIFSRSTSKFDANWLRQHMARNGHGSWWMIESGHSGVSLPWIGFCCACWEML